MRVTGFWPLFLLLFTFFFNEFLIFYLKIGATCRWPETDSERNVLRVFMIADTHILGIFQGHWFDKIKREWQMRRSFRSAVSLLSPDAVFFLGDLMDEGKWSHKDMFDNYAHHFKKLFEAPEGTEVHVLAGNHDIGFHYELYPVKLKWFKSQFNTSLVDVVTIKGNQFILLNSMAFEGDGCYLCRKAAEQIDELSRTLRNSSRRPIILQHFPLYRQNEEECLRDDEFDSDVPQRDAIYRPKYDALSKDATRKLLLGLKPRAVFNGHAHRGCKKRWIRPIELWEYTVNSFSWRNGDRPSLLLVSISDSEVAVSTCFLPNESTTTLIYLFSGFVLSLWFLHFTYSRIRSHFASRRGSFSPNRRKCE